MYIRVIRNVHDHWWITNLFLLSVLEILMFSYVELHHHKARQRWYNLMNVQSIFINTSVRNAATSSHFTRRLCTAEQLIF